MQIIISVILKCLLGVGLLLLFTRAIGNKQLGQLNVFTYISGIAVGSMAGGLVAFEGVEEFEAAIGIIVWGVITYILEWITLKNKKARKLLDGSPVIVIQNGKISVEALRKERLNLDDLTMLLRTNDVFSVAEVDYAILEANGDLSVLKKYEKQNPTRAEFTISGSRLAYPITLIADGEIMFENLKYANLSEKQLKKKLLNLNFSEISDLLYVEILENGELYIQSKDPG